MDGKVVSRSSPRRGVPREEGSLYRLWLWRKKNNFIEKPGFVVLFTWKRYHLRAPIREMVGSGKNRRIRARFTLKYHFALYSGFEEKV